LTASLKRLVDASTPNTQVCANDEMVAWPNKSLPHCPYHVDVALAHLHAGSTLKYANLLHYGSDPVSQDLSAWFTRYNGRQIIEGGIKEGK
jgi:hypothetical protein